MSAAIRHRTDPHARERVLDGIRSLIVLSEERRRQFAVTASLSVTDVSALGHLKQRSGIGPTELARLLGLTGSSVTALIDRLERAGLADRQRHPDDRRRAVVTISPKGTAFMRHVRDSFGSALDGLEAGALARIADALEVLTATMAPPADQSPADDRR